MTLALEVLEESLAEFRGFHGGSNALNDRKDLEAWVGLSPNRARGSRGCSAQRGPPDSINFNV
jgi:hypothetical protein